MPLHDDGLVVVVAVDEHEHVAGRVDPVVRGAVGTVTNLAEPVALPDVVPRLGVAVVGHAEIPHRPGLGLETVLLHAPRADDVGGVKRMFRQRRRPRGRLGGGRGCGRRTASRTRDVHSLTVEPPEAGCQGGGGDGATFAYIETAFSPTITVRHFHESPPWWKTGPRPGKERPESHAGTPSIDVIPAKASLSSYNVLIKRRNHWIAGSLFVPSYVPFLADVGGLLRTLAHVAPRFLHPMLDVDPLQGLGHSSAFAWVSTSG